jgi:HK97 family phage major capsid protein
MKMEELKQLQEQRLALAAQMRALGDTQANWTAEDEKKWADLNTAYDACKAKIDALNAQAEQQAQVRSRLEEIEAHGRNNPLIGRDAPGALSRGPANPQAFGQPDRNTQRALAVQGWLRAVHDPEDVGPITDQHRAAAAACGVNLSGKSMRINLHQNFREVYNALSGQTGTTGGFTYGESFVESLERAMLAYGGMFQVAEVIRTMTGEPMRWPTADDTSNTGVQLGESAAISEDDPTFGQVTWNAYKFSSNLIKVPFELLRDNAVNLAQVLSEMLGERLGRIQNTKYTTGTGAGTAKGIVVCAGAGVTAASATAIAFDEVIDLEHSLDPSRRRMPGVGYMFHDNILKALRKLKDGNGQYLWQSGANSGAPDTLNTYPYTINQDMASSIATTNITMLFGQLSKYKIRQVNAVRMYRLEERYRDNDQDGFVAFMEGDGNLLDAGDTPVKKLTQA